MNKKTKRIQNNKYHGKDVRKQPRKDSDDPRVNYDNTRESKFRKDMRVKGVKADEQDFSKPKCTNGENDVAWYNKLASLYDPATNVSFQPITGWPVNQEKVFATPGLYTDYWVPTLGAPDLRAVNQIKESLYSFTVHANSRNTSYDANDLMCTFVGGTQVFCYLSTLIRAYGCMSNFAAGNKNTPQMILTAMGFNYDDFVNNYPNMLFEINQMIIASRQIWVPASFTFGTRWFWMNSNIYMDAEGYKAQYYMHVQEYYWMYSEDAFETGTALVPVSPGNTFGATDYTYGISELVTGGATANGSTSSLITWKQAKEFFWKLLNPIVNSTYRGVMMGDILKAYGPNDLMVVDTIESGYQVIPVYSEEVLMQIENTNVVRNMPMLGLYQNQDKNQIEPIFYSRRDSLPATSRDSFIKDGILNFHKKEGPSKDDLMIATRLRATGCTLNDPNTAVAYKNAVLNYAQFASDLLPYTVDKSQVVAFPRYTGSEMIVNAIIYKFNTQPDATTLTHGYSYGNGYFIQNNTISVALHSWTRAVNSTTGKVTWTVSNNISATDFADWSAFDWAPWIYQIISMGTVTGVPYGTWVDAIGDWDYWGIVPDENIGNMHTAALFSQLDVPFMG